MSGPYPRDHGVGTNGPLRNSPPPGAPAYSGRYPNDPRGEAALPAATYPGLLPPPVQYPKRLRRLRVIAASVAVVLVVALLAGIVYVIRLDGSASGDRLSDAAAKTAIQGYLDALQDENVETIARNTLCGIYDAVRDRKSDEALAKLSSDAFRKQFAQADVTSIDKIVYLSNEQVQVLFTMRVVSAMGGSPRDQVQGIAQLLSYDKQLFVCSYVLRTAGTY